MCDDSGRNHHTQDEHSKRMTDLREFPPMSLPVGMELCGLESPEEDVLSQPDHGNVCFLAKYPSIVPYDAFWQKCCEPLASPPVWGWPRSCVLVGGATPISCIRTPEASHSWFCHTHSLRLSRLPPFTGRVWEAHLALGRVVSATLLCRRVSFASVVRGTAAEFLWFCSALRGRADAHALHRNRAPRHACGGSGGGEAHSRENHCRRQRRYCGIRSAAGCLARSSRVSLGERCVPRAHILAHRAAKHLGAFPGAHCSLCHPLRTAWPPVVAHRRTHPLSAQHRRTPLHRQPQF